ncbi:MAG: amidohydrolase [Acidobacteria bacterium]|nr:amidohydrolase [Acidobacteriota bacterium]
MVIDNGKIVAVGENITPPAGAEIRDLAGKVLLPGVVDTHSHIGLAQVGNQDVNEGSGPSQPILRALDGILMTDASVRTAVSGGVTTANIMPGSGNVMGGQTAYVKLRGRTVEDGLLFKTGVQGGMKMANGDNPKGYGARGQAPFTRMGVAALQRRLFARAQEYRRKLASANPPDRDLELEPIVEVLEGKRTVHFHTHRADDILTVLRLVDEFKFNVVLQHVTEGYKVADEIARRKVPVSFIVIDSPGGKLEAADYSPAGGAIMEKAGIKLAIHSDDWINNSRFLIREAALAVRGGMTEEGALRALTLNPAEMLGVGDRLGSLDPGKDADFLVLSGDPLSVYTHVLETWIDGEKIFDRSRLPDRLHQTGGYGVSDRYPVEALGQ